MQFLEARKKMAASMRTIYTAPNVEAAELALAKLDRNFGEQYPWAIAPGDWRGMSFVPFVPGLPGGIASNCVPALPDGK
jgi:hypothetical protein